LTISLPINLLDSFNDAVARCGDKTAIVEANGNEVSFNELADKARGYQAHWSSQDLTAGDKVLVAMPVSADLYAALAAIWSLGGVAVLPEPAMGLGGVRHALRTTGCKGLVAAGVYQWLKFLLPKLWFKPLYRPVTKKGTPVPHKISPGDVALISFTSGTTGAPKAIARSHAFLHAQKAAVAPLLRSDQPEYDLVAFPVFTLINLAEGRTTVLPNWRMNRMDQVKPEELAQWINKQKVTRALLPPSLCESLALSPPLLNLKTVFTGGGPVFPDVVQRMQDIHKGLQVIAVYGSTEAEPIAHLNFSDVSERDKEAMKDGAGLLAGHPVPQVQLRLIDGEIVVAGPHVNEGYLDPNRDRETKIYDGNIVFHRTGDAGTLDDDGRIWLLGRHGQDINGLHPFSVETAARLWPGVQRVALAEIDGNPVLAIEGASENVTQWSVAAKEQFNFDDVRCISAIPLDKRHRSKVDYPALIRNLQS